MTVHACRICRKLQDQLKTQQTKASALHQQVGLEHGLSPTSSGAGRLPGMVRQQSHALVPYGANQTHGHIPHSVCAPHQQLLQQHARNAGALSRPRQRGADRSINAQPASPTLGAAPTPSYGNATSLSGGSGISALLQGSGLGNRDASIERHKAAPAGSDRMDCRRRSSAASPRGSCGSLSDLIKARNR